MSKYAHEPLSFQDLKTVPIQARGGKVRIEHFGEALRRAPASRPFSIRSRTFSRPIRYAPSSTPWLPRAIAKR